MKSVKILITCLMVALMAAGSFAADSASLSSSATIVQALSLSKNSDLDFGGLVPTGTAGHIIMPADGSAAGYSNCSAVSGEPGHRGGFTVTGNIGMQYSVSTSLSAIISDGSGHSMTVSEITYVTTNSRTISEAGTDDLYIGGMLEVGANQAAGNYSGNFTVTVSYE